MILRTKRELQKPPVPPTFDKIDEIIQAMGKTTAKTVNHFENYELLFEIKPQPVKKVVDGTGQGKKQQPQQCNNGPDSDYAPPGAKKERIALQNNGNLYRIYLINFPLLFTQQIVVNQSSIPFPIVLPQLPPNHRQKNQHNW